MIIIILTSILAQCYGLRILPEKLQWLPQGAGPHDIAFTAVLNRDRDKQMDILWNPTEETIKDWAGGVRHFGMHGVVIHDGGYSQQQVRELSSRLNVSFFNPHETLLWKNTIWEKDWRGLTINDQRFFMMGAILEAYKDQLGYVLLTDSHDVDFARDPLKLMRAMDSAMNTSYIFVQDEWRPGYNLFVDEPKEKPETAWERMKGYYHMCFGKDMPVEWTYGALYNCGAIGGHVTKMIDFLHEYRKQYNQVIPSSRYSMCDMPSINKVVLEKYRDNVVSGFPFNGKFKHPDSDEVAAVLHKSYDPLKNNHVRSLSEQSSQVS